MDPIVLTIPLYDFLGNKVYQLPVHKGRYQRTHYDPQSGEQTWELFLPGPAGQPPTKAVPPQWVDEQFELKMPRREAPPRPAARGSELVIELTGDGFAVNGYHQPLRHKEREVLRAFLNAPVGVVSQASLERTVWERSKANHRWQGKRRVITVTIGAVRTAFCKALRHLGYPESDPMPCIEEHPNLTWKLQLPCLDWDLIDTGATI